MIPDKEILVLHGKLLDTVQSFVHSVSRGVMKVLEVSVHLYTVPKVATMREATVPIIYTMALYAELHDLDECIANDQAISDVHGARKTSCTNHYQTFHLRTS